VQGPLFEAAFAAGLWGLDDFEQMLRAMRPLRRLVKVKMTAVEGSTRYNITVVDTANAREMNLRNKSQLASTKALKKLQADLETTAHRGNVCVFAGAMPVGFLKGLKDGSDTGAALETATKVATARAWGWTEDKTWSQALREIKLAVERV